MEKNKDSNFPSKLQNMTQQVGSTERQEQLEECLSRLASTVDELGAAVARAESATVNTVELATTLGALMSVPPGETLQVKQQSQASSQDGH